MEEERKKRVKASKPNKDVDTEKNEEKSSNSKDLSSEKNKKRKCNNNDKSGGAKKQKNSKSKDPFNSKHISFEAADAEGWSAMEQQIHQLTQTLSRVGRVLDRHRDSTLDEKTSLSRSSTSFSSVRSRLHSPSVIMKDYDVVNFIWNKPDGIVQTFLQLIRNETWILPSLPKKLTKL